jgi:hypothetical protein
MNKKDTETRNKREKYEVSQEIKAWVYPDQADYLSLILARKTPRKVAGGRLSLVIINNNGTAVTRVKFWCTPLQAAYIILQRLDRADGEWKGKKPEEPQLEVTAVLKVSLKQGLGLLDGKMK